MRSSSEIELRRQSLLNQELQKRISEVEFRVPSRCKHHYEHPLDTRPTVFGEPNPDYNRITQSANGLPVIQTIGLCTYDSKKEWSGTICDESLDAYKCPLFEPIVSIEQVREEFLVNSKDRAWLKSNMPEVYSLVWVLDVPPVLAKKSLWQRLLEYFRQDEPQR